MIYDVGPSALSSINCASYGMFGARCLQTMSRLRCQSCELLLPFTFVQKTGNVIVSHRPVVTTFTAFLCDNVWTLRFVFNKCLHQLTSSYLVSMITPVSAVSTRRDLRSAG